eukprot:1732563-Pyramimonas_sp.AAC.1
MEEARTKPIHCGAPSSPLPDWPFILTSFRTVPGPGKGPPRGRKWPKTVRRDFFTARGGQGQGVKTRPWTPTGVRPDQNGEADPA